MMPITTPQQALERSQQSTEAIRAAITEQPHSYQTTVAAIADAVEALLALNAALTSQVAHLVERLERLQACADQASTVIPLPANAIPAAAPSHSNPDTPQAA